MPPDPPALDGSKIVSSSIPRRAFFISFAALVAPPIASSASDAPSVIPVAQSLVSHSGIVNPRKVARALMASVKTSTKACTHGII